LTFVRRPPRDCHAREIRLWGRLRSLAQQLAIHCEARVFPVAEVGGFPCPKNGASGTSIGLLVGSSKEFSENRLNQASRFGHGIAGGLTIGGYVAIGGNVVDEQGNDCGEA
jgi:hypothetical protein